MTDFRVGDIVKIERGEKGKPGYECQVRRVTAEFRDDLACVSLAAVEEYQQANRVTVIKRAPKYSTALIGHAGELAPIIVRNDGMVTLSELGVMDSQGRPADVFIETCPYVPLDLIKEAEEWSDALERHSSPPRPAIQILQGIVDAIRKYRNG